MERCKCENCHWFKKENPYYIFENGKMYPCNNINTDGWRHWCKTQEAPDDCNDYCKLGEYRPKGIFAGLAYIIKKVGNNIK